VKGRKTHSFLLPIAGFSIANGRNTVLDECIMRLVNSLPAVGTSSFEEAMVQELNQLLKQAPGEFPISRLCSPGWVFKESGLSTVMSIELGLKERSFLQGFVQVQFDEFLQRDCQDVLIEDKRSGTLRFTLDLTTGEITFDAEQYPVREFDPEEF
jgi:hypothetical protein